MFKQKKRQSRLFSCVLLMGLMLTHPVLSLAATHDLTQDSPTYAAPLEVIVPSSYTITIPQKLSFEHLATEKQYLQVTVDALLQEDEQIQLLAMNATPDGLVGLTNGKDTLKIEHRRADDDSKITTSNSVIDMFRSGKTTHTSVVQASDWDSVLSGGAFKGNFSYAVRLVKGG